MHRQVAIRISRRHDERGAVAIMIALSVTLLMVVAGLVLDFGLVKVDRQIDKSAADSAALAGAHALNTGDGNPHPFLGVCAAARYLRQNSAQFSTLTSTSGTWKTGAGVGTANGCTDTTLQAQTCTPGSPSTWAVYTWSGTVDGKAISVRIQSGYQISSTDGWSEDTLSAASAFQDDKATGCNQLAVVIKQSRQPGFGSVATSSRLRTDVRSVARLKVSAGGNAPALLLLKQTGCDVLKLANSNTKVYVEGSASVANGLSQPGTIHSDSNGGGCANNTYIFGGQANSNIVAYAAPLLTNLSAADPSKPGDVSSNLGASDSAGHFYDSASNACGSTYLYPHPVSACPGVAPKQTGIVYRKPVDSRYLATVRTVVSNANSAFTAAPSYPKQINSCNPNQSTIDGLALTASSSVYVNCNAPGGFASTSTLTINAGTIVFSGSVKPKSLAMPNATHVYIAGDSADAISLGNNSTFAMHYSGNLSSGQCSASPTGPDPGPSLTTNKAVLVIKNGDIKQTGGTFQACYTTTVMMGGKTDACLPSAPSQAAPNPTSSCGTLPNNPGNGQFNQTGGNVDWTAPNQHDAMVLSDGTANPNNSNAWVDPNGPEDLAFWSESGGGASNPMYKLTGGGSVNLIGVFMIPNAQPLNLVGQFNQVLNNAQFISSTIELAGGSIITMKVDANSAIPQPDLQLVGLVR